MKVEVYKNPHKNIYGQWVGQVDYDESQIQVFSDSAKERDRLVTAVKEIIKPEKSKK